MAFRHVYVYEFALEEDSSEDDEFVIRRPRWIRERVDYFEILDNADFQTRSRLSKEAALQILESVEDRLEFASDRRTLEDIENVLTLAKLSRSEIKNTSQIIYFSEQNLYQNDYKLLQLDSHLLSEIAEGNILYVKGEDTDEVVICSETHTFHVQEAETSNSLLLVNNLKFVKDLENESKNQINKVGVYGIFYNYLEALVGKPHLKKLSQILEGSIYKGPEFEHEVNTEQLLTFNQLNTIIQASNKELKAALDSMNIVELSDKIRLLDLEYHFRVLSYMLKLIDENSWAMDEVDYTETLNTLKDLVPKEVVNSLFDKYCEESQLIDGTSFYRYNTEKVCKFFAQVLLHESGKFNLNEFLQAWEESVPEGMVPSEDMLYGIAIIDRKSEPNVIWAFDENSLPENIHDRFKILFETKEKWSVPEIAPYIKSLTTEKVDVNALLAKHARASKMDGCKYYSSKHGK